MRRSLPALLAGLLAVACLDAASYEARDTHAPADLVALDPGQADPGSDPGRVDVPPDAAEGIGEAVADGVEAEAGPEATDTAEPADVGAPGVPERACDTTFRFVAPAGTHRVSLAGEFTAWVPEAMQAGAGGAWYSQRDLAPGVHAYKFVVEATPGADPQWVLDPDNPYRKAVDGIENSGMRVGDCHQPLLVGGPVQVMWDEAGSRAAATLAFTRAAGGPAPAQVEARLVKDFADLATPVDASVDDHGVVSVAAQGLAPGKHAFVVRVADEEGTWTDPVRLVFWVEPQAFDWRDTPLYMIMTDRFVNGDPANDPAPTPGVAPSADWHGGDLAGVARAIDEGVFDDLGVRAIWFSPFHQNPSGSHLGSDGVHAVTGYHGYWPVEPRKVDDRLGGDDALVALVTAAHARGIRVMMDFVVNHVYEDHPYREDHPEWFHTGCVCGKPGCDWTEHRLDCLFAPYMPDVNWLVPAAAEAMVSDALWWLERFDLDGIRVDAVKHVPDLAIGNLSTRVHEAVEVGGTDVFLLGETAMGWGGHDVANSQGDYDTISRYIGPWMLDGQFDFVLYHAVSTHTWAYDDFEAGLIHPDYWLQQSLLHYPADALMTPYLGSHDTPRFLSQATYRGQDVAHDKGVPNHSYDDLPVAPTDDEPYQRMRVAMAWLLTIPGLPLIYYGDEYGQVGGHDPDNRRMWQPPDARSLQEAALAEFVAVVARAREGSLALRRGAYLSLQGTPETLVYARVLGEDVAVVALNHSPNTQVRTVAIPPGVPLADGAALADALGGPALSVSEGAFVLTLPARSAAVYVP